VARRVIDGVRALARRVFHRLPRSAQARIRRLSHRVRWGSLRRMSPVDSNFGFGRGTPIGRHYLEVFVDRHRDDIQGRVLEVGRATYAGSRAERIARLDIVDIDPDNVSATIVVDLADRGSLPQDAFDCAIVMQTLQYVSHPDAALENLWQSLRPGGVALLSVPASGRRDAVLATTDRWRLLPAGLTALLERACCGAEIEVISFGNLISAVGALEGMAAEELRAEELAPHDDNFPVVTCARVYKPPDRAGWSLR
jgi:SAM-dependent methyltransferase